jgi:hypothetical protein
MCLMEMMIMWSGLNRIIGSLNDDRMALARMYVFFSSSLSMMVI